MKALRAAPLTFSLLLANLVLWGVWYVGLLHPDAVLPQALAWALNNRWLAPLTYLLVTPDLSAWLPVNLIVFGWLARDLEVAWGSLRFGPFLMATSALSYLLMDRVAGHALVGLGYPTATLWVAWTELHPYLAVRVMFSFTLGARFFRGVMLTLVYLSTGFFTNPAIGLLALLPPLLGQRWARRLSPPEPTVGHLSLLPGGVLEEDDPAPPRRGEIEPEIDRILDKIARDGLKALTPDERSRLDAHSVSLRQFRPPLD